MPKFKPGQSGNPNGRPKGIRAKVQKYCEKHNIDPIEGMIKLLKAKDISTKDAITIYKDLADRYYGKAPAYQIIEATHEIKDKVSGEVQEVLDKLDNKK